MTSIDFIDSSFRNAVSAVVVIIFFVFLAPLVWAETDKTALLEARLYPEILYQGNAALVSVSCSSYIEAVYGEWRGKLLPFSREGRRLFQAILGVDLNASPGAEVITLTTSNVQADGPPMIFRFSILKKDFPIQRISLPTKMVSLSKDDLARVRREKKDLERVWGTSSKQKQWKQKFIAPVTGDVISPFGVHRILNNEPRSPHTGVDFRAKTGSPVRASADGIVALTCDHFFSGRSVFLDHGMGFFTMYFHLSEINVKEGQKLSCGQVLGLVGQTGRATGPHLHWGARIGNSRVDPLSLLRLFH